MRKQQTPRYIKPEQICIGDTIAVKHTEADKVITSVGTVARREHWSGGTEYMTRLGEILVQTFRDGRTQAPEGSVITLLDRKAPSTQPTLAGFVEIA